MGVVTVDDVVEVIEQAAPPLARISRDCLRGSNSLHKQNALPSFDVAGVQTERAILREFTLDAH